MTQLYRDQQPQVDRHDTNIHMLIMFNHQVIVGLSLVTGLFVFIGGYTFLTYVINYHAQFVAQTAIIFTGALLFLGCVAVLVILFGVYLLVSKFTGHFSQLKTAKSERKITELLPSVPENAIAYHRESPYVITPIPEYRYNIRVDENKRQQAMLPEHTDMPRIEQPELSTIIDGLRPNAWQFCYGADRDTGELIRASLPTSVHMQLVGSSGQGKSRQAQSMLTQLVATNDEHHLHLAIFDHEEETSTPFHHLPHVRYLATDEREAARTLSALCAELVRRDQLTLYISTMSKEQIARLPIILIFVEEFLNLRRMMKGDMKEQALEDFTTLALRGRKRGMFLLTVGQTSYTEKSSRDAQLQFLSGIAFAMRPQAARSAGFQNTELLNRLYSERKPAQFLLERRGDDRLVLSPYVDDGGMVIDDVLAGVLPINDGRVREPQNASETP